MYLDIRMSPQVYFQDAYRSEKSDYIKAKMRDPERLPPNKRQRTETSQISENTIEQPVEDEILDETQFSELWSATFEIHKRSFKQYGRPQ